MVATKDIVLIDFIFLFLLFMVSSRPGTSSSSSSSSSYVRSVVSGRIV
jgi:hypothetical protein